MGHLICRTLPVTIAQLIVHVNQLQVHSKTFVKKMRVEMMVRNQVHVETKAGKFAEKLVGNILDQLLKAVAADHFFFFFAGEEST
jgi:hypothetical protein